MYRGDVTGARRSRCRSIGLCLGLTGLILGGVALGRPFPSSSAAPAPVKATVSSLSATKPPSSQLSVPKTSYAQDSRYLNDVTLADPTLSTYAQKNASEAVRALLTDGTAFCALLKRGGGIDQALVSEAEGARSTESQTKLPLSVTTFNTIEAVALLTLCPGEQHLVPKSDRSRIRRLGDALARDAR